VTKKPVKKLLILRACYSNFIRISVFDTAISFVLHSLRLALLFLTFVGRLISFAASSILQEKFLWLMALMMLLLPMIE
jgi:hypothetical protein